MKAAIGPWSARRVHMLVAVPAVAVLGLSSVQGVRALPQRDVDARERADGPWSVMQSRAADTRRSRRKSQKAGSEDGDAPELWERLERATARVKETEEAARSFAANLQQVSARLDAVERQSPDERVRELKEALRRSEAERAMLRAGRPETLVEAEVRELRRQLRESQALAKAAEALVAGGGDLSVIQEQLSTAARQVDEAVERETIADGRANEAEDRAHAADVMAAAAEHRIDLLEAKLQEIAGAGVETVETPELAELQGQLAEARRRADEMEERAVDAESRLSVTGSIHGPAEESLQGLEDRVVIIETRATEAEARVRSFEEQAADGGSRFRQRLALTAARKRGASVPPAVRETEPEMDLRAAISRGLRGPLTRASGLTLSLQGTIESGEGKAVLRHLSASLRRLDQLAADLHSVHRIADGSLPLSRRRTELRALTTATLEDATHLEDRLVRLDSGRVYARVDPVRARQIVEGMLDAAWERTRSGAAIVVRILRTDAGALVSVEDDNRSPATIGREMSLAVRLAEMHGTEITVDGSSFRVVFPKDVRT